jgi:hypothetical protein
MLKISKIAFLLALTLPISGLIVLTTPKTVIAAPAINSLIFTPQVQIPNSGISANTNVGSYENGVMSSDLLAKYIKAFYNYGMSIAGILAAIVLMGGGLLWLTSAGNDSKIAQAKELIAGSITGAVILFSSWIILNTINPDLLNMKIIKTQVAQPVLLGIGCCLDTTAKEVKNVSQKDCGTNKFYLNKLANKTTNTCEDSGCCVKKQHDGALAGRILSCTNTIQGSCKIEGVGQYIDVFQTTQCNLITECKDVISNCEGRNDGDKCNNPSVNDPGFCYKAICYIGPGKENEPCGTEAYAKCDKDEEQNGKTCKGGTGGRDCKGPLWCCLFNADGTRINKS